MRRHTISPERDRLQSRILVWGAVPILVLLTASTSLQGLLFVRGGSDLVWTAALSLLFGFAAYSLRAATPAAAACGALICFLLIEAHSRFLLRLLEPRSIAHSGLIPLILLFLLTFTATRLGHRRKAAAGLAESRRGRNAAQIIANLGVAAVAAALSEGIFAPNMRFRFTGPPAAALAARAMTFHFLTSLFIPALAALVEATADTVSSEIGQAYGGTPRMILTLRPVPPGTDGAITLTGTLAGIAAGALVAASAVPALGMTLPQAAIALAGGTAGLFFDSVIGATLERRGWIGNDLVNLSSTAFAAILAAAAARVL